MRIISLPTNDIDSDVLAIAQPEFVVDEARENVPAKNIARLLLAEVGSSPSAVLSVGKIGALEKIRYPADAPLGKGHPEAGKFLPKPREQPIGRPGGGGKGACPQPTGRLRLGRRVGGSFRRPPLD